jgi:hypothetical protein
MNITPSLETHLEQIRLIWDEIHHLRQRSEILQSVEQACREYQQAIASEEHQITALKQEKNHLLEEKLRLIQAQEEFDDSFTPPPNGQINPRINPHPTPSLASDFQPNQEPAMAARNRLKKLANRWARHWELDNVVLGLVNRIADDSERPMGEALILLNWNVFAQSTPTERTEEAHLIRLVEWEEALLDYQQHLSGEIDTIETRLRGWLAIWEQWRVRDQSPENYQRWETLLTQTKQAKLKEIAVLTGELDQLKQEIDELDTMPGQRGR